MTAPTPAEIEAALALVDAMADEKSKLAAQLEPYCIGSRQANVADERALALRLIAAELRRLRARIAEAPIEWASFYPSGEFAYIEDRSYGNAKRVRILREDEPT